MPLKLNHVGFMSRRVAFDDDSAQGTEWTVPLLKNSADTSRALAAASQTSAAGQRPDAVLKNISSYGREAGDAP